VIKKLVFIDMNNRACYNYTELMLTLLALTPLYIEAIRPAGIGGKRLEEKNIIYRIRPGYALRPFLEECLVIPVGMQQDVEPCMGILNPVGQYLWELLEEEKSFQQLLDAVVEEFDVDSQTAAQDIQDFLKELDEHHYLMKMEDKYEQ
jgi:hypothetical protein